MARLALLAVLATLGAAADARCRLALLLAIDVSSSVDAAEDALQRRGLAAALLAPEVQQAALSGAAPVAIAAYEWSGRYNQELLVDWTLLDGAAALTRVAATIGRSTRSQDDFPTAMGYALGFGAGLFRDAPACDRLTLDMAGDGENNEGFGPAQAYANFPFDQVVVNGLVVNAGEFEAETGLIDFYRRDVLRGAGAFLEIANGFDDYERAMRRKLEREMRPRILGGTSAGGDSG
ncbi:MAG: DUF1194 domain-containing protein [Marinibacterium sp.]